MTTLRSIDALPIEIWLHISSLLNKQDLLKFRLVAPRNILSTINSSVFENITVDIDGTDDLPRWQEAEADGVATQHIREVASSRIVEHVRILTLRLTRPYSLSAYYEQNLGVKNYPVRYKDKQPKSSSLRRLSSIFSRSKPVGNEGLQQPRKRVDYATELASALQTLFKATDLVKTIRIIQPDGFNSEYDVVYPSIYGRVLVRLLTAVQTIDIPDSTELELLDLPITHLEESGVKLSEKVASNSLKKFVSITLRTRSMAYGVIPPGQGTYRKSSFSINTRLAKDGLGYQLVKGMACSVAQIRSLQISSTTGTTWVNLLIDSSGWSSLKQLQLDNIRVDPAIFAPFMVACIPQLEKLRMQSVQLDEGSTHPVSWKDMFEAWVKLKEELAPLGNWHLMTFYAGYLTSKHAGSSSLNYVDLNTYEKKLCLPKPKDKAK